MKNITKNDFNNAKPSIKRSEIINLNTKIIYETSNPHENLIYFKDNLNQNKQDSFVLHGSLSNRLNEIFLERISRLGIATHFIKRINMREQLVRATKSLEFFFKIHNIVDQRLAKIFNINAGNPLIDPIIEIYTKDVDNNVHLISTDHLYALEIAHEEEFEILYRLSKRINDYMLGQFCALNLKLVNYTIEFGKNYVNNGVFDETRLMLTDILNLNHCIILDDENKRIDLSENIAEINWHGILKLAKLFKINENDFEEEVSANTN